MPELYRENHQDDSDEAATIDDVEERLREAKERGHGPLVISAIKNGIEIGDLRKDSEDSDQ